MRIPTSLLVLVVLAPALCQGGYTGATIDTDALSPFQRRFVGMPTAEGARKHLEFYTSLSHVAGTPGDYKTALYTRDNFRKFGLHAEIEPERVLLNYPSARPVADIVEPPASRYSAQLAEDILEEDPTSADPIRKWVFNGYGPSGNATGELVYVNYGSLEDFAELKRLGIDVTGRVAIARYGKIFRGLKAMLAQNHGAIGLIIYSDPKDDGFTRGDTYPKGPWRPSSGVQRGSVQYNSVCAGNIDRPECQLPMDKLAPSIPIQPMSWGDAEKFMKALSGTPAPADWEGGFDFPYHIGPGPAKVHLQVDMNYNHTDIWNVIATIPGHEEADRTVVIGNHRDAWAFGAVDPNSGTSTLLEIARSFGELLQDGWKPRRTIMLCSWDGEEYGLLGSTAFGERHAKALNNAVSYFNVDVAVDGPNLSVASTPSLTRFFNETIAHVMIPKTSTPFSIKTAEVLGSGSDYTVFLDHLGIPCVDFTFSGDYGVYHSVYDSFTWMEKFGDPEFLYHRAAAQIWGLMTMRMADTVDLPHKYLDYAHDLQKYLVTLEETAKSFEVDVDTSALHDAVSDLKKAAGTVANGGDTTSSMLRASAVGTPTLSRNDRLMLTERQFLNPKGLPHRPWFRHVITAPGLYEGYAANVFPSVMDAVKNNDPSVAAEQVAEVSAIIHGVAAYLRT